MAALSLKVNIVEKDVTKTMQFDPNTTIYDACRIVREKLAVTDLGHPKDYGLFLADEDPKKGVWLEPGRNLGYYLLHNGDLLEYRRKMRQLKVRMLDGTLKTMLVDDSQPVSNLMVVICTKIGITNHDEFSLVRENMEEELENNKPNTGTLTLRRKKDDKERDQKMEQLKKKIKTDDELNWVDQSKTLREQGIDEQETVLLRRKYFFSDGNVDSRDPVQLNLLYVQARDSILNGTHPVTQDQACAFAGIQCQVQFGDYKESKHKPGFLDLKEFLPPSYIKVKGIEKKIFMEQKKHETLSEIDAKVAYVKTARSLSTYGVTFFLVKEKMKGKNKLVPRLLGVTKDSVLRLDEKTKEILKTWPLTTVRRWAASPNTFTLDFGDYSDQYYSVQTPEGEQISQLIGGYIDIILKKKKAKDHFGIEGDEGSTMVEDSVSPLKATIVQHEEGSKGGKVNTESVAKPAIVRAADSPQPYTTGNMQSAQMPTIHGQVNMAHVPPTVQHQRVASVLSEPQRALVTTISAGHDAISIAEHELEHVAQLPVLGTDPASLKWKQTTLDTNTQNVSSQIAAMNAATASVLAHTSGPAEEIDHMAVGAAISTISSNLPEMARGVKMIAALMEEDRRDGESLLNAARTLCSAFSDLLSAAQPEAKESRQNLLGAASRVGEASQQVLSTIGEEDAIDSEVQGILLGLAKAVANTTAALVLQAKAVAGACGDQSTQNRVIGAATQCALATSQLVACAKVVAPTISHPACQQHLIDAAREVARAVEAIVVVCQENIQDENLNGNLVQAAGDVSKALNELLVHVKDGSRDRARESVQEGAVDSIMVASDRLLAAEGDAGEMVRQARVLAQATAQLIQAIKGEAEALPESDGQHRLLAAARILAEATARMVEAAKACASSPQDGSMQGKLKKAAEDLREATNVAAGDAIKKKILKRLETAAKHAAASATQCIAAAQGAGTHMDSVATQESLLRECKHVADLIPQLVQGVKGTLANPESSAAKLALISASEEFLQAGHGLSDASKAALPTVTDASSAMQLNNSSKQLNQALSDLRNAVDKSREACGPLEVDAALDVLEDLQSQLDAFQQAVEAMNLKPLPGETPEYAAQQISASSKAVGSATAQLLTSASQGNIEYTSRAATGVASALGELTNAVRAVAATTNEQDVQFKIIESAHQVLGQSQTLILEARHVTQEPNNPANQQRLAQVARGVSQSLKQCVSCLPGHKDVENTIQQIQDISANLNNLPFPKSDKSYGELQSMLGNVAGDLHDAAGHVVSAAREAPAQLAASSREYGHAFENLVGVSSEIAGQTKDAQVRSQMVVSLKNVSMVSSKLLTVAKAVNADPNAPNTRNQLAAAARAVTESINSLVDVCASGAPGQRECDNAVRAIRATQSLLDNPSESINDTSYFECLETVMDKSKSLGDGMTGIANNAKRSEHEPFGEAVREVSDAICGLIEAAAQAAYLVAVSDPSSVAAKPGLVDQVAFTRAAEAIQGACQNLSSPTSSQPQVLSAATIIAKHTSSLCNACRLASAKTTNPVAKRHFVQSAKDVANATAKLVKEIKALDQDYSPEHRSQCAAATKPLLEAVEGLVTFASSPEFASVPARLSNSGRKAQEPICQAGQAIIEGSCSMIYSAKSLAINPKDPPTWQALANHSKSVSDAIKKLVASIRDKAPGQRECDEAIEKLNAGIRDLDQASLAAISQNLAPRKDKSAQSYAEQASNCVANMAASVDVLRQAARAEAESLGHAVNQLVNYFQPLVVGAVGSASHLVNSKQQMQLLDQNKTVGECAVQLVYAAKEAGGNPKATHAHGDLDEASDALKEALQELTTTMETVATEAGVVSGLVDSLSVAMTKISTLNINMARSVQQDDASRGNFAEYQTRMVSSTKEIARLAQEMVTSSTSNPNRLAQLGTSLTHTYSQLAEDTVGATMAISSVDTAVRIKSAVQDLGQASVEMVKSGGVCQTAQGDVFAQRDLSDAGRVVQEKASQVLAALQASARGTQACINAASTVSGIIGDLDTTILFATAGTLHPENEDDTFSNQREHILKTAKALVEDTKTLVAGAASSQEQLAVAAQNAVATIVQLAESVKMGAAALGSNNPEAQVMLINAVKDVASALGDLIHATKSASGKSISDPAMVYLKDSAKVMVTNVTSLLKTVKAVEDEHTRGTRALESTIEAIAQEMRAYDSSEAPKGKATPEDLVRATKPITLATAKAVAAGNTGRQEDVIVAANVGRKAISDMLATCKAAAYTAETDDLRNRTMDVGRDVAKQYKELLELVLYVVSRPGPGAGTEAKSHFPNVSRKIATSVTMLVAAAEQLKGSDWEDPEDPSVIAENELLGAASSIDAAAKKLLLLRPRKSSVKETDESLSFDEMILEAAKSIAAATSALVKAASAAQRELIDQGKISRRPQFNSDEGQWSEGLISAARLVAAATHSLVESANALVQGNGSEEKLIAAAKQVAGSTAQLLVACKVKADPDSTSTKRLQAAGNAVKRATDNLVKAAQQAVAHEEESSLVVNKRMVRGIADEIEARSQVLRIEKELEDARRKYEAIHKLKYRTGEDGEQDGYNSGYDSSFDTSRGFRSMHLNDSDMERSPAPANVSVYQKMSSFDTSRSPQQPGVKKQPPATPPRQYTNSPNTPSSVPHFIARQREAAETEGVATASPSFHESRQKFNASNSNGNVTTTFSTFVNARSPQVDNEKQVTHMISNLKLQPADQTTSSNSNASQFYTSTSLVRNVSLGGAQQQQTQMTQQSMERTERTVTMTSSSMSTFQMEEMKRTSHIN